MSDFIEKMQTMWDEDKFVCVGLDSDMHSPKFPDQVEIHPWISKSGGFGLDDEKQKQLSFNCFIIDATHDLVCAYKPNIAFYEGDAGKQVLMLTIAYARVTAPGVPVILDAKQADIGNTNNGYVADDFTYYGADAVTVNPYLGMVAMEPFLSQVDKGIIVLCRTSNEGAEEFQDRMVLPTQAEAERWGLKLVCDNFQPEMLPLYKLVAHQVTEEWNEQGNCAVVVGATRPEELAEVRAIVGDMPILIPGIGAQGGDLEATVQAGRNSKNQGMIINSSRGIIFASSGEDFADMAREETQRLHDAITGCLKAI